MTDAPHPAKPVELMPDNWTFCWTQTPAFVSWGPSQLTAVPLTQENNAGGVTGYFFGWAGLSLAARRAFCKALTAFWATVAGVSGVPQVAQSGATAARAPSRAACVIVP